MKKKGKGILALWLILMLTIVSVLQTVQVQADGSPAKSADQAYQITHQPTAKEPYVKLDKEGASFAWHKTEPAVYQVVSKKKQDNQIEASASEYTYNDAIEGWEASDSKLEIDVTVKKDDLITVTSCPNFTGTVKDGSGNSFTDEGNENYTRKITTDGTLSIRVAEIDNRSFWAKVQITRQMPADKVTGQDSSTFTGAPGNYICVASFADGSTVISDPLEVPGYDITISSSGNGNCRTQVGGKDASSATLGQKVMIKPVPADTYEPDTIKVTKKDDSSTHVTVTDHSFIMPGYPVEVHVTFRRPSFHITLPSGIGYTAETKQSSTTEYGSDYIFTITLDDDHEASEDFSVTANDTVLTPTNREDNKYTYTLYNIIENQTIRVTGVKMKDVSGVKDENPPEIAITLNENNIWKDFMHQISFGTFFNESKTLTVSVKDSESGVKGGSVKYYLANQDLFTENKVYTAQEIEQKIPFWTEYRGAMALPDDKAYVLYVKAEDNSGNVSYASTTGIVIDTIAPSILIATMAPSVIQVKDEQICYGDSTFTVEDDYLKTVIVDGKTTKVTGSTYTLNIPADNKLHTIQATDQAGNSVSYKFYVNEAWLRDVIAVSGLYSLTSDTSYKLYKGKWKVTGDSTIYEGNCTVYVDESKNYNFQKQ